MKIIGLTGGSGAGKSTVSTVFQELGAGVVDADAVYRALCRENKEMLTALDRAFGGVLTAEGALDRPKLAQMVFHDAKQLARLTALTLPYLKSACQEEFDKLRQKGCPMALFDAPTLFQTGLDTMCDGVIGVLAGRETRISRVMARDRLTRENAAARIDAQPDEAFYRARCRYLIENDGKPEELAEQIEQVWQEIGG